MLKAYAYVKDHKWYFIGGVTAALVLAVIFGDSSYTFVAE